jgi:ATP-binding cassette, subfamily B, bacterial
MSAPDGSNLRVRSLRMTLALLWRAGPGLASAQLVGALLTGFTPVMIAWSTKLLIDRLTTRSGPPVTGPAVLLAVAGGVTALAPHLVTFARQEHQRRIVRYTSDRLFTAVCRIRGLERLENPEFHDRLQLAQQAGQATPQIVGDATFGIVRGGVTCVGLLGALATLSPVLTVIVVVAALPELFIQVRLGRRRATMRWRTTPRERRRLFYQMLLTEHQAAKEIRLFGIGDFLRGRMLEELDAQQGAERRLDRTVVRYNGTLTLLGVIVSGGALILMVSRIASGQAGIGDLAVLTAAVAGVQSSLTAMVMQVSRLDESLMMIDNYDHIVALGPDLPEPVSAGEVGPLRRGIELRDVWFRYGEDQPWVLRGMNLLIPYGRSVALVGVNGAGKSTIVKLLCRLYDPERGSVLWDGTDLRDLPIDDVRRRIGAVFQDYMSYDLTGAENIAVGDIGALDQPERLEAAARWAGIHDTLADLPLGYQTSLSRFFNTADEAGQGVLLSGGQWQRVALARAALRADQADLLILDEPSSGLDPDAEHAVHERLRAYRADRTSVLISHRLNTVRGADQIVVLVDGVVAEEGTHGELMNLGGEYSRLFLRQASGFEAPAPSSARAGRRTELHAR